MKIKNKVACIIGGSNGIGLAITLELIRNDYDKVFVLDIRKPDAQGIPNDFVTLYKQKVKYFNFNLLSVDLNILKKVSNIDTLVITAGFGRVATFDKLTSFEIDNLLKVDLCAITGILKYFYPLICSKNNFYTLVMGSIAGHVVSPLFSVYGAAKSGLCSLIENLNIELEKASVDNRILDVSPGALKGTNFNGDKNNISVIDKLARVLVRKMFERKTLYIPDYDEVYKDVIKRYHNDPHKFGLESFDYKVKKMRVSSKPRLVVGYLSGTFDLFHIGHLNILKRAKAQCDYLVVGIHKDGSRKNKDTFIPLEERKAILSSIKYVDKVVDSTPEDSDMWKKIHYHKLFVGSDYKGSERFKNYAKFFKDKNVEIVFFPYTKKTSSTQLREVLLKNR